MATVYLARDTELRRDVAIKVLFPHLARRPEVVSRFAREARAAAALDHPHILRVIDIGGSVSADARHGDRDAPLEPPHLVLELVRGPTLDDVIKEHGPPHAEIVACLGVAICRALSVAHAAGIVHRDVKPANLMVADGGRVVLADFGVARVSDEDSVVTRTGAILGTPSYMSPEQATAGELGPRSDLYSLGATLYQLATGVVPFSGPTTRVIAAILAGNVQPAIRRRPAIGPDLSRAIAKMMATEPEGRHASADEAAEQLAAIARAGGIEDIEHELAAYFADPSAATGAGSARFAATSLAAARAAAEASDVPRAIALADRVLALDPTSREAMDLVDELGKRRSPLVWIAASAVALAAIGVGAYLAWPAAEREAAVAIDAAARAAVADAAPVVAVVPPAADAATAPVAADAAPARPETIDAAPDPRPAAGKAAVRKPRTVPDAGAVTVAPVDPPVAIDAAPAVATPPRNASISVKADTWCNLSIDGNDQGRNDGKKRSVAPGRHVIACAGERSARWQEMVDLAPGEHRALTATLLSMVSVTVKLSRGDRVRIKSRTYASGARLTLKQGQVRVELQKGETTLQTKHVNIGNVTACTLRDDPELRCVE